MTKGNQHMTRQELLHLAALDVFGLLDPYEAELFDRSYHNAPASVQDELVALQASLASDPAFLHEEEPSADLRARVLRRVAEAVEQETEALAPIPIFQRRRAQVDAHRREVHRLERSTVVWRAASFVFAACFVIAISLWYGQSNRTQYITELALLQQSSKDLTAAIGQSWQAYIGNPHVQVIGLRPENEKYPGIAAVYINPAAQSIFIAGLGLPSEGRYQAVARNNEGEVIFRTASFLSDGSLATVHAEKLSEADLRRLAAATWEILDLRTNERVLHAA